MAILFFFLFPLQAKKTMIKKAKPPVYSSSQSITVCWIVGGSVAGGCRNYWFYSCCCRFSCCRTICVCAVGKRPKRLLRVATMWDILLPRGCRGVNLSPLFPWIEYVNYICSFEEDGIIAWGSWVIHVSRFRRWPWEGWQHNTAICLDWQLRGVCMIQQL